MSPIFLAWPKKKSGIKKITWVGVFLEELRTPQVTFEFYWSLLHFFWARISTVIQNNFRKTKYQLQNDNFAGDKESSKDFLEGQVVQCLESKFIADAEKISPQCKHELEISVQDEAMDYR